jgi:hypothetical protein
VTLPVSKYIIEVDEFYNPDIQGDDKHVEMRLESYDAGGTLIN